MTAIYTCSVYGEFTSSGDAAWVNPFPFQTQFCDANAKLYRLGGGVWYSAALGRMTRRAGGDEYPYVFEGNNPVNMTLPRVSEQQASMAQAVGHLEGAWRDFEAAASGGDFLGARRQLGIIKQQMMLLGYTHHEAVVALRPYNEAINDAIGEQRQAEYDYKEQLHRYDGWYTYIPIAGTYVNMLRASYHNDDAMFAMYSGFFAFETLTLGAGAIESKPAQILAQQGLKAALRTAGSEALAILTTKVTRDLALRVGSSMGRQAVMGALREGALGAGIGGAMGWYNGQGFWQGALNGAYEGILSGAVTGAAGWFFNPTCFAAGTEVVVGVEYEDEDENGEVIVRSVTARRLSQMGKEKRAAILEKARLKIIRYTTCAIELLKAGDWVLTRDESDAEGELILRLIEEKFERTAYNLLFLTIRSSSGQTQTLTTTNEHPVYVEGLGWIEAIDLEPGQEVLEPDGGKSTVIATRHERHLEGIAVYNFRVNECHTYFVREQASQAEPVWVHNAYSSTSGANSFQATGRTAHAAYSNLLVPLGYTVNRAIGLGSKLRPDAWKRILDNRGNLVGVMLRELKPNNPAAIAKGWRQLRKYENAIKKAYPQLNNVPFLMGVDVY